LGFERENLEGLPLDAATRNYRDPHHKPELLVAVTDFYALHGFRPIAEIEQVLAETPELAPLAGSRLRAGDLADLYGRILRLGQPELSALLLPLIERLEQEERQRPFSPQDRRYWILRAHREFSTPSRLDRGLLSMLLLNLIRLRPGQAVFLTAGELHSYLRGVAIEIMANSNNVLRGGLTRKHVDPEELLQVLIFRGRRGEVLTPETESDDPGLAEYRAPVAEFALSRLALDAGKTVTMDDGEMGIVLISKGVLEAAGEGPDRLHAGQGQALLMPAGLRCRISTDAGAVLWLARVPARTARR
jgi:mannose-6-phosphate isomerase class I